MPPATRKPPAIVEIGTEHWSDGKGNVKEFLLGGPDVGKTRWSSAFPRPLWLACESVETVAASIATRKIDYLEGPRPPRVVDIRSTQDMIDTIAKLEGQLRTAGPDGPSYRTAVVDTFDGFQRTIKDEWSAAQEDGIFTGRDAWSYLEAKCNLILTRLLALDMNVIILCHLQEKTTGEGDNKVTTYGPFLQGQTKDSIFHDFNLVGLMQTEWTPGEDGDRARKRGITYEPTPIYPFLKDHFHLTPPTEFRINNRRHWPVTLDDGTKGGSGSPEEFVTINYGALVGAIFEGMDGLGDGAVVEQLSDATGPSPEGVVAPGRGGPVAGAPAAPPAKTAAAKKAAAPAKAALPAKTAAAPPAAPPTPPAPPTTEADGAAAVDPATAAPEPGPESPAVTPDAPAVTPDAATAVPEQSEATSAPAPDQAPAADEAQQAAVEAVQDGLDAEVVAETTVADAEGGGEALAPGTCPVCGGDTSKESADLMSLSRLKHRDVVARDGKTILYDTDGSCFTCYQTLNEEKQNQTGHYAASA